MNTNKLSGKMWTAVILFGLIGQVAWIVENMYFNVFIDRTITPNPAAIWAMVAASAVVAMFATLVGGTWSDRIGKRRQFMSYGYIIWGIIIMSFALVGIKNTMKVFHVEQAEAVALTTAVVVIMDCVMTYVGSTANDAAFNAWVTDNTNTRNRGKVEGVLAVMPLLAMAAVFGGLDWMTQDTFRILDMATGEYVEHVGWIAGGEKIATGNWTLFYCLLGGIVAFVGVVGLFLIKDSETLAPNPSVEYRDMFYGFKPKVVKENKNLYLTYGAMTIIGIANNAFIPYIILYVDRTLGYSDYILPVGAIIALSAVGSVVFGVFTDKSKDRRKFVIPLIICYCVGAVFMLLTSPLTFGGTKVPKILLCLAGMVLMCANLCLSAVLTATVRDLTPTEKIGQFQGIRMFFWVLIPMVIGPLITVLINADSKVLGYDFYGAEVREYTPYMFLIAAVVGLFAVIPAYFLNKAPISDMVAKSAEKPSENESAE